MIIALSLITLLFPVILSRPPVERMLASYTTSGADWTGTCSTGVRQSPIDIDTSVGPCDSSMVFDLTFADGAQLIQLLDNDETIRGATTASTLYATDVNGLLTGFQSVQFHFHAPSEHKIEGDSYDLELHFVHNITSLFATKKATTRTYAVVAVLFQVDDTADSHPFIDALNLANVVNKNAVVNVTVDMKTTLYSKFPTNITYYTYEGSFSAGTCAETVNWYVMDTVQKIKSSQLAVFTNRWKGNATFANGNGNNREVQDTEDRTIKRGGVECEEQFVYFFSFVILFIFINYFIFKIL